MTPRSASGAPGGGRRPAARPRPRSGAEAATRERFAERATRARWQTLRRRLVVLLVLAVVAALVWLVGFSSVLGVGTAEVTGADEADVSAVEEIALEQAGTPLARVDTEAVAEQLVAEVPGVAHAEVGRGWPSTLTVEVTSRVPALAVRADAGYRLVDLEGVAFRTVDAAPKGIPVVTAEDGAEVTVDGVHAASEMLRALPEDLRSRATDVRVDAADQVSVKIGSTRVVWGDASEPRRKVEVIQVLLAEKPKTIDVSAPDNPVTRG